MEKMKNVLGILLLFISPIVLAQTGIGDNFNNGVLSCRWSPNTYTLTENNGELTVGAAIAANSFNTFDFNFPTNVNINSQPTITVRIRSSVGVNVRIDLKDSDGRLTNATPTAVAVTGNNTYATYTFTYTGRFSQVWPAAATVNANSIAGILVFVNPGGTAFSGNIVLDDLQIGVGGITDGGASGCVVNQVAGFSANIRLNQLGFYPQGPKTAIILGTPTGNQFTIKTLDLATTVFTGTLGNAATWNYSNESVRVADFSALSVPGIYVVDVPGIGTSYTFEVKSGVHVSLNKASLKAFYFNRSSTALDAAYAGIYARAAGHPDNSIVVLPSAASAARPAGTILSSPKGWYDAGDYNSYVVNSGISTYTLLHAYEQFKSYYDTLNLNIPESGNSIPDILDEIKWNLDWMLTMQDPNDGGVYNKKTNANFDQWVMPAAATSTRYMCAKGTAATFDFAAVMAVAYRLYLPFDPTFANACLSAATAAYNWGRNNPNVPFTNPGASNGYPGVGTGEYGDTNLGDEYEWAATELYIATLNNTYYTNSFKNANSYLVPDWAAVRTLGLLSLVKNRRNLTSVGFADTTLMKNKLTTLANTYSNYQQSSAYRVPMGAGSNDFVWGSNAVAANQGIILLSAFRMTNSMAYYNAALAQLDYLLGRNPTTYCYVTGFGKRRVMRPHHRPSEADGIVDPIPGWLAGGPQNGASGDGCTNDPNPALAYVDGLGCYTKNEITINWNAPLAFLSSGLEVWNPYVPSNAPQLPSAAQTILGSNLVCPNTSATFSTPTVAGASTYTWVVPSGVQTLSGQGTRTINVTWGTASGTIWVYPINAAGTGTGISLGVTVRSITTLSNSSIVGSTLVCANQTSTYAVNTLAGVTQYQWSTSNGASIQGQGNASVSINWGATGGLVTVVPVHACGTGSGTSIQVQINTISTLTNSITGVSTVCAGSTNTFTIQTTTGISSYQWSLPSMVQVVNGAGTNAIQVQWGTVSGTLTVNGIHTCGNTNSATRLVSVSSIPTAINPVITGPATLCTGTLGTYSVTSFANANAYQWTIPSSWSITQGQGSSAVTVRSGTVSGIVSVTAINSCGTTSSVNISVAPLFAPLGTPVISGQTTVCAGSTQTFTIQTTAGISSYQWSLPSMVQLVSGAGTNAIQVQWGTVSGTITANGIHTCGNTNNATSAVSVSNIPTANNPTISGPNSICAGSLGTYSTTAFSNVTSYQWSVPASWTIIQGQGSSSVSVQSGTVSGMVRVNAINACGTASSVSFSVSPLFTPIGTPVISGPSTVCAISSGLTYQTTTVTGASQYIWTSSNGTIGSGNGTTSISISIGSNSTNLQVSPFNTCGTGSSASFGITVQNQVTPSVSFQGTPSGSLCVGNVVTLTATALNIGNAPTYRWIKDGQTLATTSNVYSFPTDASEQVSVIAIASSAQGLCLTTSSATSSLVTITANPVIPVSVSAQSPQTTLCAGTLASVSAIGWNRPATYEWLVNGQTAGNGNPFQFTPQQGDIVNVKVTATGTPNCFSGNPATSNGISFTVNPLVQPTIAISTNSTSLCSGTLTTLTATGNYTQNQSVVRWLINDNQTSTGQSLTFAPSHQDNVQAMVSVTGLSTCWSTTTAVSSQITYQVSSSLVPSISISSSLQFGCSNAIVNLNASISGTGNQPGYIWIINNQSIAGNNLGTYTINPLSSNATIRAVVTTSSACANPKSAVSNTILVQSIPNGTAPCLAPVFGSITGTTMVNSSTSTYTYSVASASGVSYQWLVPSGATIIGSSTGSSVNIQFTNGVGTITVIGTNAFGNTTQTITIQQVVTYQETLDGEKSFQVYPNPFTNSIHILGKIEKLKVYNNQGIEMTGFIQPNQEEITLGEEWPTGMYIIDIYQNGNSFKKKVVKY